MKDSLKFKNILVAPDKDLNYVTTAILKKKQLWYKKAINEESYSKLRPFDSKPGTLSGSAKANKPLKNVLPPFTPIPSLIWTLTYKLA